MCSITSTDSAEGNNWTAMCSFISNIAEIESCSALQMCCTRKYYRVVWDFWVKILGYNEAGPAFQDRPFWVYLSWMKDAVWCSYKHVLLIAMSEMSNVVQFSENETYS
jgi:hypothetical protein